MQPSTVSFVSARRQHGVAALAITLLLCFAMILVTAYAHRGLLFEQRASANQYRTAQAFEAAEAGIEWAIAQLNHPQRVDGQCLPSTAAADPSFRERYVQVDRDSGQQAPVVWTSGSAPIALQPACVRGLTGWSCRCPSNGHPALDAVDAAADDGTPHPAFTVQFGTEAQAGLIRVTATGCSSADGPCRPGVAGRTDAAVRLQVLLGLLPGLSTVPPAPLTVKGSVDAGAAALGVHNTDPRFGGVTVRAGGSLIGSALRLVTAPGGTVGGSASTHDAALASIDDDRLFASHFGVSKATWHSHAAVQAVDCRADCSTRIAAAIERSSGNRMVSIDGDARLDGPVTLGSPGQPVIIVVDGGLTLSGEVTLYGLLYAADIRWDDVTGPQAQLHGALISESAYRGNGAPDLHHDAAVLRSLQLHTGSYARVPGSWRDF